MKYEIKEEDIVDLGNYRGKHIKMYLPDRDDYIQRSIRDSRLLYQEETLNGLLKYMPVNPNVIDIGSYTGSSAIWFSRVAGASHVTAVEPDEYFSSILKSNIEISGLNNEISVIQASVSDSSGFSEMVVTSVRNMGATQYRTCSVKSSNSVPEVTIDGIVDNKSSIDVIHIAMEGNEYKAIRGAYSVIENYKPLIVVALWPPTATSLSQDYDCLFGYTKLLGELAGLGYVVDLRLDEKVVFVPDIH